MEVHYFLISFGERGYLTMTFVHYINYVIKHYGGGTIVLFDGYGNGPSTKDITHIRRCKGKVGRDEFLVNLDNRQRFLEMLTSKLNSSNFYAIQSSGDADAPIVNSATEAAKLKSIVAVGKYTDVLMLLIHGSDSVIIPFSSLLMRNQNSTKALGC